MDEVRKVFNEYSFQPGTGFFCDLVEFPPVQGKRFFTIRTYRSIFDPLQESKRLIISEQLGALIKMIRALGVHCYLEVWYAPGQSVASGSKN